MNALDLGYPTAGRRAAARSVARQTSALTNLRVAAKFALPNAWKGSILGGLVGLAIALSAQSNDFRATAEVLVRPDSIDATFFQNDTRALLDTEVAIVRSAEIVTESAMLVPGVDPFGLHDALTVTPDPQHSTLRISVRAEEAELARTVTNAVTTTYLTSVQSRSEVDRGSMVSILHEATQAVPTADPRLWTYLLIGLVVVGLGCFVGTMLSRMLDPRLRDPGSVEYVTGRPLVGAIPRSPLDDSGLVMVREPSSPAADAYRSLVSSIPFFALEEGVRCVAVTGAASNDALSELHSDVAGNLAIACADSGIRTMLVSGDLRHKAFLTRQLKAENPGLTELILSRAPWRESSGWRMKADGQLATGDVVYTTNVANLTFVPTGGAAPNPGDILSSRAAGVALSHLKHLCDLVILDTPNYTNPETSSIVRYAEAVIAVVSRGTTRKSALHALAATTRLHAVPLYFVLKETRPGRRPRAAAKATDGTPSNPMPIAAAAS